MQYYLNGFHPGDPGLLPTQTDRPAPTDVDVDVLIVGTGPAGLVLAAQLAQFPEISTRIVERRGEALELGQADGVACRSVEMFEAFGLSDRLVREAYWVNETVFWRPDEADRSRIVRSGRVQDVEDGLSEFPHVIVNQARVHDYLLESMQRSATGLEPDYCQEFVTLEVREDAVVVTLRDTASGTEHTVRARYVVGCDGAHSAVRTAIGRELHGDRANHAWGVLDSLSVTDFPDIRFKAAIQSEAGTIILIPREGGYLFRLYVDLGEVTEDNRDRLRALNAEDIAEAARGVLKPYTLDVQEVVWFSVYEVAQRLTDGFDDVAGRGDGLPRVFIAGDACHTHSAKAGQGMNVSMQDAFNLGWKLAAVLRGRSDASLLRSYSAERQPVAKQLIDFDKEWSTMIASPHGADGIAVDPATVQDYFVRQGRYTAGVATRYLPGGLTGDGTHQALASGLRIGERFHSSPVIRVGDARPMHLGHVARADARWRMYLFGDASGARLTALLDYLRDAEQSPLRRGRAADEDIDAVIDVRAVFPHGHREIGVDTLHPLLAPRKGRYSLVDYEKAFALDPADDIYAARGINRDAGAVVIVRPDQYIADVLPLDDTARLTAYFDAVLLPGDRMGG